MQNAKQNARADGQRQPGLRKPARREPPRRDQGDRGADENEHVWHPGPKRGRRHLAKKQRPGLQQSRSEEKRSEPAPIPRFPTATAKRKKTGRRGQQKQERPDE